MKNILSFIILSTFVLSTPVIAEGSCKLCERIREENKGKVNPYAYYEDYLKANEGKGIGGEKATPEDVKKDEAVPANPAVQALPPKKEIAPAQ